MVKTEFGQTIAGFTAYKWDQVKNNYVNDTAKKTLLMQVDKKERMRPRNRKMQIFCKNDFGPMFGNGDLFISNHCN